MFDVIKEILMSEKEFTVFNSSLLDRNKWHDKKS